MRVLFLANTLDSKTGWGRFSREIIEGVKGRGVKVRILTEYASGYEDEKVILSSSFSIYKSVLSVRKEIRDFKPDVVHSLEVNPYGITVYLASLGIRINHIITATGAYSVRPLHRKASRFLTKRAYSTAFKVLCISKYIENEILKVVSLKNTMVIPLGVEFNKFYGSRKQADVPFIIGVGNMSYRKGYEISVAGFAEVAKKIPDVKYFIVGQPKKSIVNTCKQIIKENDIEDRVVFKGSLGDSELLDLYLSAELFILTSVNKDYHFEGFGLVFLEAAAAGLPVIGTTGNGIIDAVNVNKNGLLVEQYNVEETADAIYKILSDKELKKNFSESSIEWAKMNIWERVIDKYIDVYEKINE